MRQFGLIGKKLKHSFSKKYFTQKFEQNKINAVYDLFEIEDISCIHKIIHENNNLCGFNVTIPYKEAILYYLSEIDCIAKEINAVNTVKIFRNNNLISLKGYNTDIYGFEKSLAKNVEKHHKTALILGNGGASKAVQKVLETQNIDYTIIVRNCRNEKEISFDDLTVEIIRSNLLIINATPLGMFPETETFPALPYNAISTAHLLFDLVYNPLETKFLTYGKQNGAKCVNGLEMLYYQADKAYEIFLSN